METLLWYLLKSTLVSGIFFGTYHITLRKETFYRLNRFFLLLGLCFSYLFPFIKINIESTKDSPALVIHQFQSTLNQFTAMSDADIVTDTATANTVYKHWWIIALAAVSFLFLIRFSIHLFQIIKNINAHEKITHKNFTLVFINRLSTFSFFRYIFISQNVWGKSEGKCIIDHELSHVKHKHSLDRIFIEIMQIVFWMNPFIYLYRKALEEVHELQADRDATENNNSIKDYFDLVLQQSAQQNYSPLMSPFSFKLIKKRIKMATYQSKPRKQLLVIAPIVFALLIVFASATIKQEQVFPQLKEGITWPADNFEEKIVISDEKDAEGKTKYASTNRNLYMTSDKAFILINWKGDILCNGKKTNISSIEEQVKSFYSNSKQKLPYEIKLLGKQDVSFVSIHLQKDINTPKEKADELISKVSSGIKMVRNEAALKHFQKTFIECNKDEQGAIIKLIPKQIIILPSKNIKGKTTDKATFISPIRSEDLKRISSTYGIRLHPILKLKRLHSGIDYVAEANSDILAIGDGIARLVVNDPKNNNYGKYIIIDHEGGYSSLYAHLNDCKINEGQRIKKGEAIGLQGNTGIATRPHLHLEVKKDGVHIDPAKVISKL